MAVMFSGFQHLTEQNPGRLDPERPKYLPEMSSLPFPLTSYRRALSCGGYVTASQNEGEKAPGGSRRRRRRTSRDAGRSGRGDRGLQNMSSALPPVPWKDYSAPSPNRHTGGEGGLIKTFYHHRPSTWSTRTRFESKIYARGVYLPLTAQSRP